MTNQMDFSVFEVENARSMSPLMLAKSFVPFEAFDRLLSLKNHVVTGSRGCGKTQLLKMISFNHLRLFENENAKKLILERKFVGTYLPTKTEWIGALKNKNWQSLQEKELFFTWRVNLASCLALIDTFKACLEQYSANISLERQLEKEFCESISNFWLPNGATASTDLDLLKHEIDSAAYKFQIQYNLIRNFDAALNKVPEAIPFINDIFSPFLKGIEIFKNYIEFPEDTGWFICIDEAEVMDVDHHRILNSAIRTFSSFVFLKLATMPYAHYTLATNVGKPLSDGEDFGYINLDTDKVLSGLNSTFAENLFEFRLKIHGFPTVSIVQMLGHSRLQKGTLKLDDFVNSVKKHCNKVTITRVLKNLDEKKYLKNSLIRKLKGLLILKEQVGKVKGNVKLAEYSGKEMVINCGDCNPRRYIRIFNHLIRAWDDKSKTIPSKAQNEILTKLANSKFESIRSTEGIGPELYIFLQTIGTHFRHRLHSNKIGTDQISSFNVLETESNPSWPLIEKAVGEGYMQPIYNRKNDGILPKKKGKFRISYQFCPKFLLLPRNGSSISLSSALHTQSTIKIIAVDGQLSLFPDEPIQIQ